ncbi:hypothetical protein F441_07854 [Phytophthora nicotianae CJ01A1]|uniref:Uncharacterized protein n=6 Tax=Phytophthora nicotianae TaxID=4792 RepID=V9FC77_PHYNI|nr:hypothetical protein PPTG_10866 [Phytophthora nicotianae INRA-310]ETI48002.1 hypothetical protein F443_07881 [Phytophthora nicotianae P1569]ETK87931.1 hypothetical protein L915_07716 [Phytophthora nicotianae]ETO76714.1 hypothetical protein F444_07931 [Phytophthora nicotianae P1976]ETP17838.1 hypothetical protein F441_07854 [Phytophthora nicotianae CJ01A1]ETP45835.1 hypothetical protein F442_07822 [Phytophthora nicotianae P10297]KUF98371.1 Isopentenyl-diphosphate Delta-isomerase I [Phytopht
MGNVCSCCNWGRGNSDAKDGKSKKLKKDVWFEQDSVPLVSARHDLDDIGSDEADGSLKRKVLIRSPRPTSISPNDELSSRTSPHLQRYEQEERQHRTHRAKAASVDSSSYSRRSHRGGEEERSRSHSGRRHRHSGHEDNSDDRDRRIARSTSLEVQDSTHEMRSPSSSSIRSTRVASYSHDAASFADDEVESVGSSHGSTRSHRSSSASSSPKASSRSGSPHKKQRYGRKHYRADVKRK